MKHLCVILWFSLLFMSACERTSTEATEDISLKLPGIEFTSSLNRAKDHAVVEGDHLVLKSEAKSDNFNDPDGKLSNSTAPVLLSKVDNTKPFTLTAKVTPVFIETYDAGAMYVYLNKNSWVKFAFERDERKKTRIVTVRTLETSDDNNHDVVDSTSVFMKISSDTKTIGYYYSVDKSHWQLVRLYRNDYPPEIHLGLSSQSPIGNGTTVTFEECILTQTSISDFRMGI